MKAIKKEDLLWARTNRYKRLLDSTRKKMNNAFSLREISWSVSFSGGKDSLCVLHLCRSICKEIYAVFVDSGAEFPETLLFIESFENLIKVTPTMTLLEMYKTCGDYGCIDNPPNLYFTEQQITDTINIEPIGFSNSKYQFTGNFTGLRMQESRGRYWFGKTRKELWSQKNGLWRCEPLLQWTHHDVWAYVASNNIQYNPIYDKFAELEIPREEWRVSPYAGSTGISFGRWARLKKGWPELFNRFAEHFPQARCYI